MYCSECGGLTSTEAAFCPHCGTPSDAGLASRSRSGDDGTLVVDGSDSESWATISEAIRNARPHDRILVRPGVYRETLTIDLPLEIAGDGPAKDVVILSGDRCAVEMRTEQATLRGLTLRCSAPGSPVERYCVDVTHGQLVLEDCDIASAATACVNVRGRVASALMRRCAIHGGATVGAGFQERAWGRLEDCKLYSLANSGIACVSGGRATVRRTRFHDVGQAGVYADTDGTVTLEDCALNGSGTFGAWLRRGGSAQVNCCKVYDNRVDGINVQSCGKAELRDSDVFRNGRHGVTVAGGASVVALGCRLNVNGSYAVHAEAHTAQAPTRVTVERSDVRGNRKGAWSLQPGCQVRRRENREPEPAIGWRLIEEGLRQAFDDIAAQFESVLPSDGGRQSAPIDLRRRIEEKLARCDDLVVQIESSLALELLPASSPERRAYHLALELRQLSQQVMSGDPLGADMVAADDRATRALEGLELVLQTLEPAEHS